MTKINKREFYVFFLPLLGFWALLITIYLNQDSKESFKLVPTFLYIISSSLTVFNIQSLINSSNFDPIVKNAKTRGLLICLLISSISIFNEFSFKDKNLLPSIIIVFSTVASFFLTGLFDYSNEQLEEKFLERSYERNFSIESRELWGSYLDQIEIKYETSDRMQREIIELEVYYLIVLFLEVKNQKK